MSLFYANLIAALAISLIITCMVTVKGQRAKSIVLILPIPITIALLGSGGRATSLSVIGLALTNCFVWSVYALYRRGWHILLADVLIATLYVLVAYVLTKLIHVDFAGVAIIYVIGWVVALRNIRRIKLVNHGQSSSQMPLPLRSIVIFLIALLLFSLKQYLAAFVVTFPYNTVFAVYENRQNLLTQAALFTRNSIALLAYFVANYYLTQSGAHWYAYVTSWTAFGIIIVLVSKKLPLVITNHAA